LTDEEQRLFDRLVADIERNREHVLDVLAGEAVPGDVADSGHSTDAPPTATDPVPDDAAPTSSGGTEPPAPEPEPAQSAPDPDGPGVDAADLMGDDTSAEPSSPEDAAGSPEPRAVDQDDSPAGDAVRGPEPAPSTETGPSGADASGGGEPSASEVERATLRITRDVGEILGVDERAYDLGADDVVTLPEANAGPLVERDAAERLE
jgi:DNA replication factor GINS